MKKDQTLAELIQIVTEAITDRSRECAELRELIVASDARIDRVNEMVLKLSGTINQLTSEYSRHLDKAADARDLALKTNAELVAIVERLRADLDKQNTRFEVLLEKFAQYAHFGNNISVK